MPKVFEPQNNLPEEVKYLSASSILTYLKCPLSWKHRYIDGVRAEGLSPNFLEGKAIHYALELGNIAYIDSEGDGPLYAEADYYDAALEYLKAHAKEVTDWKGTEMAEMAARAAQWFTAYCKQKWDRRLRPIKVEQRVTGHIEGVPILGYVDLLAYDEKTGREVIVDYKTGKTSKTQAQIDTDIQMGMYSLLTGVPDVAYLSFVKTKTPKLMYVSTVRSQKSLDRVKNVVRDIADAIGKEAFPCCNPAEWNCSISWCDSWHVCPQGGGA